MWIFHAFQTLYNLFLKKPLLVIWNITDHCNQDCRYCNAHNNRSKDLSTERMLSLIKVLKQLKIKYAYIQGGEPLLRKDLLRIIDSLIENDIKPTVITNGILINDEFINGIKDKNVNLSISLETLDREKYKIITGYDGLEIKLKNIGRISKVRHKGNWSITTTLTGLNYDEIIKIKEFAERHNFMYALRTYIYGIGTYGAYDESLTVEKVKENIITLLERLSSAERKENYPAYLIFKEQIKYLRGEKMHDCDAAKYSIVLNSDGSFSPCIEHTNYRISGNADEIMQYLKSEDLEEFIKKCNLNTPCFHGCARNIGILYRNKFKLLLHFFGLVKTFRKFNAFF